MSWPLVRLRDCIEGSPSYGANAPSIDHDPKLPRYVRITDILDHGALSDHDIKSIGEEDAKGYILAPGDFIFARTGATVGKAYLYKNFNERQAYAGYLIRFRPDKSKLLPEFLEQYTKSQKYWTWVKLTIRAGAQPNINAQEYGAIEIPLPQTDEQYLIIKILSVWDSSIEKMERLIEAKILRHNALSKKLLNRKSKAVPLKAILKPTIRAVSKPDKPYWALGIRSHCKGTFRRLVEDPNSVAMDTLYRVKRDDLIVNITFAWEGAIAFVVQTDEDCFVSHRFPTYDVDINKALPDYLRHVIVQKRFIRNLGLISPGGAGRNRVLNKTDFLNLKISLPEVREQERVGDVLNTSLKEISLLKTKLELLKKQKCGLMQKLLTGQWMVKTKEEER